MRAASARTGPPSSSPRPALLDPPDPPSPSGRPCRGPSQPVKHSNESRWRSHLEEVTAEGGVAGGTRIDQVVKGPSGREARPPGRGSPVRLRGWANLRVPRWAAAPGCSGFVGCVAFVQATDQNALDLVAAACRRLGDEAEPVRLDVRPGDRD